jgi:hypothetical protein
MPTMTLHRNKLAAAIAALGWLAPGCVIVHEAPPQPRTPPPTVAPAKKAPPPRRHSRRPPPVVPVAPPPNTTAPPVAPPPDKPAPPAATEGQLVILVTDGVCEITIDNRVIGVKAGYNENIAVGKHTVSCAPANGTKQVREVEVVGNGPPTSVIFTLSAKTPTDKVPPIPRPMPTK